MVNQWVVFVRQYAKDNNISYGCAISEAGQAYRNMKQGGKSKRERVDMESMSMEDFDVPKKKVGKTCKNPWITFVKNYSQQNGIKYNEALKEIKQLGLYK
jgi:predicted transcriptional regulator